MVQQRRQEMGVRLALGAQPADIPWSVLGHGAKLPTVGALRYEQVARRNKVSPVSLRTGCARGRRCS